MERPAPDVSMISNAPYLLAIIDMSTPDFEWMALSKPPLPRQLRHKRGVDDGHINGLFEHGQAGTRADPEVEESYFPLFELTGGWICCKRFEPTN